MCWLSHIAALEVLGLKADFHLTMSPHKRLKDLSGGTVNDKTKGGNNKSREKEKEKERKRNECPFNLGKSGNIIPIPIEAPLWSYERARSQTVLLSSLSLVLWLNYLWKTSIEDMWWVKAFFTYNTKSNKKKLFSNGQRNVSSTLDHVKECEPPTQKPS